jgi:hypothetical protein
LTHYPDLSAYTYLAESIPEGVKILTVGWLGSAQDFPVAEPTEDFLQTLEDLCREHRSAAMRGYHACGLDHVGDRPGYPYTIPSDPAATPLGDAELRVVAEDGTWLAAPNLVYHYVRDHHYAPSAVFVEAVLARRVASSP